MKLHCFADSFEFPASITARQKRRLIGNSLNVLVVRELLNFLLPD